MRTGCRLAVLFLFLVSASLVVPARPAGADAVPSAPAGQATNQTDGQDSLYRIIAISLGAVAGATAMGLFIDGWVLEMFTSGGLSMRQAVSVVRDLDSQGGFEAAAVMLGGLSGGLAADRLHTTVNHLLPDVSRAVERTVMPGARAVGRVATNTGHWFGERLGAGHDWIQARSREWLDRSREWLEDRGLLTPDAPPLGN